MTALLLAKFGKAAIEAKNRLDGMVGDGQGQIDASRQNLVSSLTGPNTPPQPSSNPFMDGLKRAAMVPVNAVKLPFQLANKLVGQEMLNDPRFTAGDRAAAYQRDLSKQVTGADAPYSEGREWANMLSLGLVPGNPSATVDPSQLSPEQQGKFGQMNPLEQALLQAKRPQDFADLMDNDALFAEEEPTKLVQGSPGTQMLHPETGAAVGGQVPFAPQVASPGAAVTQGGKELYRNDMAAPVDESVINQRNAAAGASEAAAALSRQKVDESNANIKKIDALADKARNEANAAGSGFVPLADRNKIQAMEKRASDQVMKRGKDLERGFTASRNFMQLYELRDASSVPKTQLAELESMGFKDIGARDPRSIQDVLLLTAAVRIGDPPGRITDKDIDIYSRARVLFDPGIVEAIQKGQVLTDAQRNEMALAVKKLTTGLLQSNDMAVVDGRNAMLRDRIQGGGAGMNPMNIPDQAADIRMMLFGEELGDQAAYPLASAETEALLEQLWDIATPGRPPTPQALVEFANTHGFRVNELGE